jgi:nicotinamidase-related amidase
MDGMNRALVVIDVQESFRAHPSWSEMANQQITEPVGRLVEAARAAGERVVWLLHAEPGTGGVFDPAGGDVRVMAELKPDGDEPVITKTSVNAFTTTNLQQYLVVQGLRELIVCGIRTEQCCETTARVAADLGFDVTFVTDATTTSGIEGLSAADIIDRTERVLGEREFATIATTDDVVADLTGS